MKLPSSNEALNFFIEKIPSKSEELKTCLLDTKIEGLVSSKCR